jgi:N-acetylmuramoyl-L-alanine amidase
MLLTLLTLLTALTASTDLVRLPSPDGARVAVRHFDTTGGRTILEDAAGRPLRDFPSDLYPVGWDDDGRLLLVRLRDDGHELTLAEPLVVDVAGGGGEVRPRPRVAAIPPEAEWGSAVARAAATRPVRGAPGPRGAAGNASAPWIIAVDPGHGGPGAAKWNGVNGDGAGAVGPSGLTEQWVNLRVAHFLLEWLAADPRFAGSFATRTSMTQAVSLADRVALAAAGGADLFVSIHHNGLPTGATNRTETYWCRRNALCEDEGEWSEPAALLHDRLVEAFGYVPRGALEDSSGSGRFHFYVLRYSAMPSALTEASNLNDAAEEDLFGNDPDEDHARDEARALYAGLLGWFGYPSAVPGGDGAAASDPGAPVVLGAPEPRAGGGWTVPAALSRPGVFRVDIVDPAGRHVRSLADLAGPGRHLLSWDGRDTAGRRSAAAPRWLLVREGRTLVGVRRIP